MFAFTPAETPYGHEFKHKTKKPEYIKPSEEVVILLLGKLSVGKSALGNELVGKEFFREASPDMEGTSEANSSLRSKASDPSLSKISSKDNKYLKAGQIRVIDTPGLGDTEDLRNLKKWWVVVREYKISCVLLCVLWNTRIRDEQVRKMFDFYKRLLGSFTKTGKIVVVFTMTPEPQYMNWEKEKWVCKENWLKMIKETLGENVDHMEFVNTKEYSMRKRLRESIERIFFLARTEGAEFLKAQLPLLPEYIQLVPSALKLLKQNSENIQVQIDKLDQNGSWLYIDQKAKLEEVLQKKELELYEKSTPVRTPAFFHYGNEIIGYWNKVFDQNIILPNDALQPSFKSDVWNCTVDLKLSSNNCFTFDIIPDFFCIVQKDLLPYDTIPIHKDIVIIPNAVPRDGPKRWFAYVRVQFYIASEEELCNIQSDIKLIKEKIIECEEVIKAKQSTVEFRKLVKEKQELDNHMKLLSAEKFNLDEIDVVTKLIHELSDDSNSKTQ